uniref:Carboxypeptidase n=1 Tax=Brassica campestris TaxID=3711 RepID=M4CYN6_BRACM
MEKNALWLLCVLVLPVIACGNKEDDLVTGLPGQPPVNFRHYSGYVNLGPRQKQKSLFYWFFEAQQNTARRPLVLWLNGGPGCSAIATGAAQELGPFLVHTKGGNLTFNEFSWNKEANILFLEAPVGVGFSYSNNSTDLQNLGDQVTAEDSLVFLINWFKKFPEFRSNEFYITGESYAGHYVPQLAEVIHDRNKKVTRDSRINLKGIMIGNPVINEATDAAGIVDYAWSHALISDEVHKLIHDSCRFGDKLTAQCNKSFTAFTAYAAINIYSIYTPVCLSSSPSSKNYTRVIGDTDGRLPVTSTRYSLRKMRLKVESPWRSWFHKSEVAGWVETYAGGLTFVTVRGAGHQVPLFAPAQSLTLFSHFVASLPLPSSRF